MPRPDPKEKVPHARWSEELTDKEIASLSHGVDPRLIRPDALIRFIPFNREVIDGR